jgi:hypothetical protein
MQVLDNLRYIAFKRKIKIYLIIYFLVITIMGSFLAITQHNINKIESKMNLYINNIEYDKLNNSDLFIQLDKFNNIITSASHIENFSIGNNYFISLIQYLRNFYQIKFDYVVLEKTKTKHKQINKNFNIYDIKLSISSNTDENLIGFLLAIDKNLYGIKEIKKLSLIKNINSQLIELKTVIAWFVPHNRDRLDTSYIQTNLFKCIKPNKKDASIEEFVIPAWEGSIMLNSAN